MSSEQTKDDPWTVLRLLEWTTDFFKKKGSDSARLDAEILLAHARDCSRIDLYTAFAEEPTGEQRTAFKEMIRRRGEGTPVAQLVGYKEFYSLKFRVDNNVLIPRPETEHLVIEALDVAKQLNITDRTVQIADIGTGSGAIAVSLSKNLPGAQFTAVDQSESALEIAKWNADKHGVDTQINFVRSDLLASVDQPAQFDIICTNPPYVSEAEYGELDPTVRDYEPREALVAGPNGTETIRRIINDCSDRICPQGRLIIELSPMIAGVCETLVKEHTAYEDERFIKDLEGHKRILSVRRV